MNAAGKPRGGSRIKALYAALAICLFLLIGLTASTVRPAFTDYAPYLSFSPDRDGVKALRLLMERRGADVAEWRLPPEQLPATAGALLISVEPFGMTAASAARLRDWAEQGNDVVIFGPAYELLSNEVSTMYVDPDLSGGKVSVYGPYGEERVLLADVTTELRFMLESAGSDAWSSGGAGFTAAERIGDEAGTLGVSMPVGAGRVTAALTSEWLRNDAILEKDHAELAWLLLGGEAIAGRTVYFDEYHHGYSISPGAGQVYPPWLLALLAQAALAAAVWIWVRGKQFGPAYTPRAFLIRRGDETLLAVASWHMRGRLAYDALNAAVLRLHRTLQASAGAPPDAGAAALAAAAKRAAPGRLPSPDALHAVLERWEALRRTAETGARPEYSDKQWLRDSAVLAEAQRTLEEGQ